MNHKLVWFVGALAECLTPGCGWYVDARNAMGLGAQHAKRHPGHHVGITCSYAAKTPEVGA